VKARNPALIFAVIVLLLAALYAAYSYLLHPGPTYQTVIYGLVQFVETTGFIIVLGVVPVLFFMMVILLLALRKADAAQKRGIRLAVLLLLISVALFGAGMFRNSFTSLWPVQSARLGDHVYNLAVREAVDGDRYYLFYECDSAGISCTSQFTTPTTPSYKPDEAARLVVDEAADTISLEIDGEIVYTANKS
jgi:hypothetical protein